MDMLDNLLSVGLVAFILFICAAIYFKDKKETKHLLLSKKIFLSKKINNRKVIVKEFSKTLEFLRTAFRESYSVTLIIFLISHNTFILWQLSIGFIVAYLVLEIVKKISLKENKKFDKRFYLGIIIICSTILYLFTTSDKGTSSWSILLNATAGGILGGGTLFSLVIIVAYILEKIYLKLFNKKEKLNTNLDNGESNISQPDINKREDVSSRNEPLSDDDEISDEISNEIYEQIHDELDGGVKQKGLWTRAIAESGGDENKSKSLYIKMRFKELKERQLNFERIKKSK
tara:strand:+ start:344 stop:1207 length:864 start_codon:yes stop_codon:yes gene_type:complete